MRKKNEIIYSQNNNGIFIDLSCLNEQCLVEIRAFLDFIEENKKHIQENTKAMLFFQTEQHISEKSYETITRFVKHLLIQKKELTSDTKLLKRIIQHNSNDFISNDEQKQIDTELLMLEQAIETNMNYANSLYEELCMKQNYHMN